jgi:chromosome segregation ATPase
MSSTKMMLLLMAFVIFSGSIIWGVHRGDIRFSSSADNVAIPDKPIELSPAEIKYAAMKKDLEEKAARAEELTKRKKTLSDKIEFINNNTKVIDFFVGRRFDTSYGRGVYEATNMSSISQCVLICPPEKVDECGGGLRRVSMRVKSLGERETTVNVTNQYTGIVSKTFEYYQYYEYYDADLDALTEELTRVSANQKFAQEFYESTLVRLFPDRQDAKLIIAERKRLEDDAIRKRKEIENKRIRDEALAHQKAAEEEAQRKAAEEKRQAQELAHQAELKRLAEEDRKNKQEEQRLREKRIQSNAPEVARLTARIDEINGAIDRLSDERTSLYKQKNDAESDLSKASPPSNLGLDNIENQKKWDRYNSWIERVKKSCDQFGVRINAIDSSVGKLVDERSELDRRISILNQ